MGPGPPPGAPPISPWGREPNSSPPGNSVEETWNVPPPDSRDRTSPELKEKVPLAEPEVSKGTPSSGNESGPENPASVALPDNPLKKIWTNAVSKSSET